MPLDHALTDQMLAAVPSLRAFAISLSGNVDRADDLVQETLMRAIANIDSFQPGTNMSAWLFTILRNLFRSEYRKRRREVEDADGSLCGQSEVAAGAERPARIQGIPHCALASSRRISARRSSWSAPRASPTRKPRRSANAPSARSRAASTARARVWPTCCRSKAPRISGLIIPTRAILSAGGGRS